MQLTHVFRFNIVFIISGTGTDKKRKGMGINITFIKRQVKIFDWRAGNLLCYVLLGSFVVTFKRAGVSNNNQVICIMVTNMVAQRQTIQLLC